MRPITKMITAKVEHHCVSGAELQIVSLRLPDGKNAGRCGALLYYAMLWP